jgi:hypothetical protein
MLFDDHSAAVLDDHIAIVRDNIRVLTQQAAEQAISGIEESFSAWIAEQRVELELLLAQRAALRR